MGRSDYRKARKRDEHNVYAFKDYLLDGFLVGEDWTPDGGPIPGRLASQPFETARAGGHFVHLDGEGKPAMKNAFLNHLSGYPYAVVKAAIEMVRAKERDLVVILEWHQDSRFTKPSRYKMAADLGMDPSTLSKKLTSAAHAIYAHLREVRREWEKRG